MHICNILWKKGFFLFAALTGIDDAIISKIRLIYVNFMPDSL